MNEKQGYVYRYRPLTSVFAHHELEKLLIHFSPLCKLNDPMENYVNLVFHGDEIAYQGLLKHYLWVLSYHYTKSLINYNCCTVKEMPLFLNDNKLLSSMIQNAAFDEICSDFFETPNIKRYMQIMSSAGLLHKEKFILFLVRLHALAYIVINRVIQKQIMQVDPIQNANYRLAYEGLKSFDYIGAAIKILNALNPNDIDTLYRETKKENNQIREVTLKFTGINRKFFNPYFMFDYPEIYAEELKRLLYSEYSVTCFTDSWNNELMWAHYADGENGICLCYRTLYDNMGEYINLSSPGDKSNSNGKFDKRYFSAMNYDINFPEMDFFRLIAHLPKQTIYDFFLSDYDGMSNSAIMEFYENDATRKKYYVSKMCELMLSKAYCWSYEKEKRIINFNLNSCNVEYDFANLDHIIFGRKVRLSDKQKVKDIILRHCKKHDRGEFKFYDLYYSSELGRLQKMPSN